MKDNKKPSARERILQAAKKIFAERGYSDTTIQDIIKAANVTTAYVYQQFNSKEGLFLAAAFERITEDVYSIEERLFGVKDSLQKIRIFTWIYARSLIEDRNYGRLILMHLKPNLSALEKAGAVDKIRRLPEMLIDVIKKGQKSGEIKGDIDPHSALILITGTIETVITAWYIDNCSYDIWYYIEEIFDLVETTLKPGRVCTAVCCRNQPAPPKNQDQQKMKRKGTDHFQSSSLR